MHIDICSRCVLLGWGEGEEKASIHPDCTSSKYQKGLFFYRFFLFFELIPRISLHQIELGSWNLVYRVGINLECAFWWCRLFNLIISLLLLLPLICFNLRNWSISWKWFEPVGIMKVSYPRYKRLKNCAQFWEIILKF